MPVYTFTTLNDPLATDGTLAHGINGSGQIVGQYANNNTGINGFLLSGGTYTTIADPLATQHFTEALGTRDRSSAFTLLAPTATTASSTTPPTALIPPSTILRPPTAPLRLASTITARSSAFTSPAAASASTAFS